MGTKSLHLRVAEADVILRGRVTDPAAMFVAPDGKTRRQLIEVHTLEAIKGKPGPDPVRIAQDGHAVAIYRKGDEALFFLRPIAQSRELRSIAMPGGPTFVSGQEHDEEFIVEGRAGAILLSATRAFVASESAETTADRVELIRGATLDLLTSREPRLASAALSSLVLSPHAEWITTEDLPRLHATISDPTNPIGFRAGLIDELERRGLVDGDHERLALLRTASPEALPSAIRAVGSRSGPTTTKYLLELIGPESKAPAGVLSEAMIALGASRDPRALEALARGLEHRDMRVRNASIRGLGLFGGANARAILSQAGSNHPDPTTRRRALGEARKPGARGALPH